ncbi:MAG: PAS domain-containing protein [Gammaproteobacteria bacterium]|nr:PAS domain-containing protein [Gammaproteobacteria bacterium]
MSQFARGTAADNSEHRLVMRLTLGYALLGAGWIVLSDQLLGLFVDPAQMTLLATAKGLTFVLTTTSLLYLGLRAVAAHSRAAARDGGDVPDVGSASGAPFAPLPATLFALLTTFATLAVQASLGGAGQPIVILFMLPITLSALLGGAAPGMLSTALSVGGLWLFGASGEAAGAGQDLFAFRLFVLFGNGLAVSLVSRSLHRSYRKLDQALRREREARDEYRVLSDQLPDPVWRKDRAGRYLDCNARFANIVGRSRQEILGVTDHELFEPPEAARVRADDERVMATLLPLDSEEYWPRPANIGWVHVQKAPVLDANGACIGTIGIARDVNRRRLAERALQESEALFRSLFDIGDDAVLIAPIASDGRPGAFTECNAVAERMFGHPRAALLRRDLAELLADEDRGALPALFEDVARSGRAACIATGVAHDGRRFPVELVLIRFAWGSIDGAGVMLAVRDISARVAAEVEKAHLHEQVAQMQKLEAIGQLTGGIAHDFNNILATIVGYTGLAQRHLAGAADPQLGDYLEQVQVAAGRGRDLVSRMMAFSRQRTAPAAPGALQPGPAVREALELLRSTLPSSIEIRTEIEAETGAVACEAVEIEQLLMNLTINARDAMDGVGRITVGLRRASLAPTACTACLAIVHGEFVELSVSDTGAGISAQSLPRIFQPFFTTKEVGKGTGLGLAVVHGIVHRAGGHVLVESVLGQGTSFRLFLPCLTAEASAPGLDRAVRPAAGETVGRHLFVIDDEVALARYWRELLESEGYRVSLFHDSREALAAFLDAPAEVDAVLSDLTMPHMSGDLLAERMLAVRPTLPVILMSGNVEAVDTVTLTQRGIRACWRKPVDAAVMLQTLAAALESSPAQALA